MTSCCGSAGPISVTAWCEGSQQISFGSRDYDVIWEGARIDWRDDAWKEYSEALNGAIDAAMRERGWPGG
jgi:hypothetical protein